MRDDEPAGEAPRSTDGPMPDAVSPSLPVPATAREVAQFVAQRAAACVGADYSNVAILNPAGQSLRLYHGSYLDPQIADRYTDVPIDAAFPLAAAAREGRSVLLPDLDAYAAQYPEIIDDTVASGIRATASLPLYRSDDTLLGAIGFAWTEPTNFDEKLQAALRAVALLSVETVLRAERYDAEHELIVELQARLLGHLPLLPGIEMSARYLPAGRAPSVGGDWYEGLLLGDSRMAVVVGDVTGHGIAAAADMALIRGMISALLHGGTPPGEVFGEVSGVLCQRTGLLLATAALVVVDLDLETITFATAGHPPPLLRLPDGEVRTLHTASAPMVGIPAARRRADTAPFPAGSQLVMYTDGLVERRDRPFDAGIARAVHHLATLPQRLKPDALVASLLDTLIGETKPEDDIAIVVVEHAL